MPRQEIGCAMNAHGLEDMCDHEVVVATFCSCCNRSRRSCGLLREAFDRIDVVELFWARKKRPSADVVSKSGRIESSINSQPPRDMFQQNIPMSPRTILCVLGHFSAYKF